MDIGIKIRTNILFNALMVENLTSAFLGRLLGISDVENSKTLGNKSGSLSFNQKVDLLIEIGALSKDEKKKFQTFMEIRNQFMHNLQAKTYQDCFAFLDGKEAFLIKLYKPDKTLSKEKQLEFITQELCNDVVKLTAGLMKKVEEKIKKEVEADQYKDFQKVIFRGIEIVGKKLDEHFEKEIQKGTKFNAAKFRSFGTDLNKLLYRVFRQELKKLDG
jgi:uncharacterized protein YktA (UPF0223 family)